jgi:Domain of unknown function (DUF222)
VRQDPFPSPGAGDEEPDGSLPPPDAEDGPGPEQGLFVCLPAEDLDVSRFAQHGQSDAMPPGPLLASVVHALTGDEGDGLAALSDDQLVGIISAARRMECRAAWTQMAAIAEFATRRRANQRPAQAEACEFAADELAAELRLTWQSAAGQIDYACAVADRLPRTLAALAEGRIHPVHVRIIEDETSILSAANAATADEALAEAAGSKTFGQLRAHAHRLILKLDPEAARKRKEAASREAHVRRFREGSGNAGMVARELPPDEVLASWQHVEQRALDLRAAGLPGTLRELRVRAYLDLLQERDSRLAPAAPDASGADQAVPSPGHGSRPDYPQDDRDGPGDGRGNGPGGNGGPGHGPADGPARSISNGHAQQDPGPSVAALVNITVPWSAWVGQSGTPGEAAGFGLLDARDIRAMVAAAARHPRTRWCVTALDPDGTAAAHGCAPGFRPAPALSAQPEQVLRALGITLNMIIRGPCHHAHAERRYRPGRKLRHLVNARNTRCTAPGCGQPAARCDLDHTTAWHHGGPTCPCNLAPLCRHHHRCKQAEGWWLEQPGPGPVPRWRQGVLPGGQPLLAAQARDQDGHPGEGRPEGTPPRPRQRGRPTARLRPRTIQRAHHRRAVFRQAQAVPCRRDRYGKREFMYQGTVDLASIRIWLRDLVP